MYNSASIPTLYSITRVLSPILSCNIRVKELSANSVQAVLNKVNTRGGNIANSRNIDDLIQNNQISNDIGDKRDAFATANNIRTDRDNVAQEINSKDQAIHDQYSKKYNSNESEYQKNRSN